MPIQDSLEVWYPAFKFTISEDLLASLSGGLYFLQRSRTAPRPAQEPPDDSGSSASHILTDVLFALPPPQVPFLLFPAPERLHLPEFRFSQLMGPMILFV